LCALLPLCRFQFWSFQRAMGHKSTCFHEVPSMDKTVRILRLGRVAKKPSLPWALACRLGLLLEITTENRSCYWSYIGCCHLVEPEGKFSDKGRQMPRKFVPRQITQTGAHACWSRIISTRHDKDAKCSSSVYLAPTIEYQRWKPFCIQRYPRQHLMSSGEITLTVLAVYSIWYFYSWLLSKQRQDRWTHYFLKLYRIWKRLYQNFIVTPLSYTWVKVFGYRCWKVSNMYVIWTWPQNRPSRGLKRRDVTRPTVT
jgi:hypothetical protein